MKCDVSKVSSTETWGPQGPHVDLGYRKEGLHLIWGHFRLFCTVNAVATRYTTFYLRNVINSPYVF